MRRILPLVLLFSVFSFSAAHAQYNVFNEVDCELIDVYNDVNMGSHVSPLAHSEAEMAYMRKVKRNERNFFETKNGLYFTQYSYNNWAEGGSNSVNGKLSSLTKHVYKNKKLSVDSYLNMAYGLNYQGANKQKTEDYFELNSDISHVIWNRWSYTFGLNIKSQFTKTYKKDRTDYLSTFFAPGTVKPYAGFRYTYDARRTIMISPLSANMLFVLDPKLSDAGSFGITPGKKMKANVGIYLNVQWEEKLTKDGLLKYKTNLQSFYDYKGLPNLSWENWIDYSILRFFSVNLYVRAVYDEKIDAQDPWQLKESFGIGITYNFKNK
ncbi:MAG: DUF3078 domain-containing protein [Rikenellaceae bacterium]